MLLLPLLFRRDFEAYAEHFHFSEIEETYRNKKQT